MAALSERERLIYSIVESHTHKDPKGYCTQRELVDEVNALMPDELQWNDSPKSHDHCFPVWSAVRAINASPEVDKIVIVEEMLMVCLSVMHCQILHRKPSLKHRHCLQMMILKN